MDRKTRLVGRNAAPPAADAAPRSSDKDGKRSMLDSLKTFRKSYISDLILSSQVKVFSRFKGLKTTTVDVRKDGGQIKEPLVPPLLASTYSPQTSRLRHPGCAELEPPTLDSTDTETQAPMLSSLVIASQKRKQSEEHDDAPSRTKSKSRPMADDPQKRHIVQAWVNQQEEAVSPTAIHLVAGEVIRRSDSAPFALPISDAKDDRSHPAPSSRSSATVPGLNRDLLDSILHHRSDATSQSQPQAVTSCHEPLINDERRGSTATTTNMTIRDSVFSTCPSVATGLTSSSEISLPLTTGRRFKTESRSSSFFGKASPRSSIASNAPSPQFFLYRTLSSNSAGLFEDIHELAKHPVPNVPKIDPLRSHPTFLNMDLGNVQNAVIIDQMVKMGHIAQERRVGQKAHVDATTLPYDKSPLLGAVSASAPTDLAPITETASDDGASSARKMQLHGLEPTQADNRIASNIDEKVTPVCDVVCQSSPGTPESADCLSDTLVTSNQSSRNLTPATSVVAVSDMSMNDAPSPQSEESDDSLSDITDYTEESLFEAVEAFGPGLSNPLLLSIIMTFKDEVLRLVLARVTSILGDGHGATQHNNGESSAPSSGASSSNGSRQNHDSGDQHQRNRTRKRVLDGDQDGSKGDEDDDRGKRSKPTLAIPSDLETRYSRLACPFFKRYPGTKWKGACCGPGFTTVHRIKEHVYRKHAPPYCQRCHITFDNEKGLEGHLQAEIPCTVRKGPLTHQGITPEQRTRLKCRKKANRDASQTEVDRWVELYSLLFPEVPRDQIPSPHYELKNYEEHLTPTVAAAFRQLLDEDLPIRIARQLEERLRLIPGAQSNFVGVQLPDVIRDCIQEALDSVPPQILAREEPTLHPEAQVPTANLADTPDSHNTAQIGSQFASVEPAQDIYRTHGESVPEVTLPDNSQPWVPSHDHLNAIFNETYFPNPLVESADGFHGASIRQSYPAATAFTTIGFPSAMLSGTPVVSPALPEMSFDGFDFTDSGIATFRGNLASMHNTTFLFTQDETSSSNGNVGGHQPSQNTY